MKNISSLELLRQLKREYVNKTVSALVGAGFSKNAIPSFPTWSELLLPIVKEMYQDEFDTLYVKYSADLATKKFSAEDKERKACEDILDKYGNLEVVSEYIRRKGIGHESIDAYIDKYIKLAEKINDDEWQYDGKPYTINALKTHEALLRCRYFRSIYTTNYDNLLELTQDMTQMSDTIDVVRSETTLPDTASNRVIVKLHGDVKYSADEHYEFDGDKNLKYIIAKEDYDTYMAKHQGFSYLMRLAMLQGRFCLIGFSGSDPNYMLWLQWMKDVLDKAQEHDKAEKSNKGQSILEKRVYLISAHEYKPDAATDLFYKNHHVGVIDLTDREVQKEMLDCTMTEESEVPDEPYPQTQSALLELLFAYLQEGERKDDNEVGKGYIAAADLYTDLWSEAYEAFKNHTNLRPILQKIDEQYDPSVNPLQNLLQETLLDSILKHESLTENADYRKLVSLSVRDMGTLPSYYERGIRKEDEMDGEEIWGRLLLREAILTGEKEDTQNTSAYNPLDCVMHYAFAFDFPNMHKELEQWQPSKEDQPKRWLLLSLFQDREKDLNEWDEYIAKLQDEPKKMNARDMRNIQSREYPFFYDTAPYQHRGGVTISEKIREASTNIVHIKKNTRAYGMQHKTYTISSGDSGYEKSLRLINLMYDTAFLPMYYARWLVDDVGWYEVFSYVYETYPYPAIYYSSYIHDSSMQRRMGQDVAYSKILYPEIGRILTRLLKAYGEEATPKSIKQGLLAFSREMYVAVKPRYWEDLFMQTVFASLLNRWNEKVSTIDDDVKNVGAALGYITKPEIVNTVFIELAERIDINVDVADYLMHGCRLKYLQTENEDVQRTIMHIINVGHLETYALLYKLLSTNGKLNDEQRAMVGAKIEKEDLSYAQNSPIDIYRLSYLATDATQRNYIKDIVMAYDAWDIRLAGQYFSTPILLNIAEFPKEWKWTEEEIESNLASILDNILEIREIKNVNGITLRDSYLTWLENVIVFAHKFGYWKTQKGVYLTEQILAVMKRLQLDDKIEMLLMSNENSVLLFGFNIWKLELESLAREDELIKYQAEISVMFTRALLFDANLFQPIIVQLCYLIEKFPRFMIERYMDKLLYLLFNCRILDYKELNVNLATIHNRIQDIARVLYNNGVRDEIVADWLKDEMLTRFNSRFYEN